MRVVSATEAKQRFGEMLDAAQKEPVLIRRQDRDIAALVSIEDYQRIHRAKAEAFLRFTDELAAKARARGLTDEIAQQLLSDES